MLALPDKLPADVTFVNEADVFNIPKKSERHDVDYVDFVLYVIFILAFLISYSVFDEIPAMPPTYT